jgi:hypothetical protein
MVTVALSGNVAHFLSVKHMIGLRVTEGANMKAATPVRRRGCLQEMKTHGSRDTGMPPRL